MEKEEVNVMIAENQISFDFDAIKEENEEEIVEESSILPAYLISSVNHDYIKDEVLFVVVKVFKDELEENLPALKICGKSMIDWVLLAGSECEQKILDNDEDILETLRNLNTDKSYIAVFYSDTPLLDKTTFNRLVDYFTSKGMNFLQLQRGFLIRTNYLKIMQDFKQGVTFTEFDDKTLIKVDSAKKINYVAEILYDKILSYHMKNGVIVYGADTVFVDADVEIENGVIIYPNNIIQGESIIEKGVILRSGNIIVDSIISSNSVLTQSYIEKSKVGKDSKIGPFTKLINEEI